MLTSKRVCLAVAVSSLALLLLLNNAVANTRTEDERLQEQSLSATDRISCRWLGLCGVSHLDEGNFPKMDEVDRESNSWKAEHGRQVEVPLHAWEDAPKTQWVDQQPEKELKAVPEYVLKHAPLVHLFSEELYWPSDIQEHLRHITPKFNYDDIPEEYRHPTPGDLGDLNDADGEIGWKVFLESNDNIEDMPAWLTSEYGIPIFPDDESHTADSASGVQEQKHHPTVGGRSSAPAVLLVIDKGNGIIDAMWHFFYSYNLGNGVFGIRFGNHVGDWEHSVVRFINGTPSEMFLSEHAGGVSYTFDAMEKDTDGIRPIIYSAVGTHAMYAKPGLHPYIIPFGILKDQTDEGPLWDPAQNFYAYHYEVDAGHDVGVRWGPKDKSKFSNRTDTLAPSSDTPHAPVSWFHFAGHWGDKFYPLSDKRQYRFFSEWAHVSGPPGPKFKAPGRRNICIYEGSCSVLTSIEPLHWILRVAKDWLVVAIITWLAVVLLWGVLRGFRRSFGCCFRRGKNGDGETEALLTGARMEQPLNYGAVGARS